MSEDVITSQKFINERNIKKSLLFQSFNQFKKKASFSGILSNTTFSILECILLKKGGRYRLKRFQGVIISFPIDKKIKKHTLLLKKSMFRFRFGLEQIVLECIEANNKYKIYSESQQEARYLLSPVFLEKLTKIKKIFRCSYVDISFFDGKMMLAFHTRKNLFESYHLFQNALDIRLYERFYDEVDSIRKLINFLNIENKHLFKKHPLNSTNSVKLRKINEIRSTFVTILCSLLYLGAIFLLLYLGRLFPSGFIAGALRFLLTLISTGGILFFYGIL